MYILLPWGSFFGAELSVVAKRQALCTPRGLAPSEERRVSEGPRGP